MAYTQIYVLVVYVKLYASKEREIGRDRQKEAEGRKIQERVRERGWRERG